jgi:hypothetical protein
MGQPEKVLVALQQRMFLVLPIGSDISRIRESANVLSQSTSRTCSCLAYRRVRKREVAKGSVTPCRGFLTIVAVCVLKIVTKQITLLFGYVA